MKVLKGVPSFSGGRGWSLGTFSPLLGWFAAKVVSRAWSGFSYMPKLKKEACFRGRIVQTKESRSTASISGSSPGVTLGASCSSGAWRDGTRGLAEFGAHGNGWSGCRGPRAGGCAGSGASVTSPLRGQRVLAAAELLSSKLTACHPNQASRLKALAAPNSFGVSPPRGQVPERVSLWAAPSVGFFSF